MLSFLKVLSGFIFAVLLTSCFTEVIPHGKYGSKETQESITVGKKGVLVSHLKSARNNNQFEYGQTYEYSLKKIPEEVVKKYNYLSNAESLVLGPAPSTRFSSESFNRKWFWNGKEILSINPQGELVIFTYEGTWGTIPAFWGQSPKGS